MCVQTCDANTFADPVTRICVTNKLQCSNGLYGDTTLK